MVKNRRIAATVLCAALFGAGAQFALAQPETAPQTPPPGPAQGAAVSDAELTSFTQAAQKLAQVQSEIQAEMQQAGNAEEAQKIQANSQARMVEAVESTGMSVDDYNRISTLAQSDPAVRERLQSLME